MRSLKNSYEEKALNSNSLLDTYFSYETKQNINYNVFRPYIEKMRSIRSGIRCADLNTRGTAWLLYLRTIGVQAEGADCSGLFNDAYRHTDLKVHNKNPIQMLENMDDNSQDIVSIFDILEKVERNELNDLLRNSLRVLKPSGLLLLYCKPTILSVQNRRNENLTPEFLKFVLKECGFPRIKNHPMNADVSIIQNGQLGLEDVLSAVGDYIAIVAQKPGSDVLLFDQVFDEKPDFDRIQLIRNFDQQLNNIKQDNDSKTQIINSILASTSWRVTLPLRKVAAVVKNLQFKDNNIKSRINKSDKIKKFYQKNDRKNYLKIKVGSSLRRVSALLMRNPFLERIARRAWDVLPSALQSRIRQAIHFGYKFDQPRVRHFRSTNRGKWIQSQLECSIKAKEAKLGKSD